MTTLFLIFFTLLGLTFGSFSTVLLSRVRLDMSIGGRSRCIGCKRTLSWRDLIPVISFLLLRGRCRTCGSEIGMRYLLIELATTACFLFGYFSSHGDLLLAIALSLIFWGLLLVTIEDYETQTIPDLFNGIVLCGTLLFLVVTRDFQSSIFGALFGGGFFFAQWLYKRGLFVGSGDIILGAILGLWLGLSHTLIMIALAYIIGAMISIALLLRKKTNLHSSVPFGPFLALGALCSFFGAGDWYLSML